MRPGLDLSSPNYIADISAKADQKFLADARKRSPQYPSFEEAQERRHVRRENLIARALIMLFVILAIWAQFSKEHFPLLMLLSAASLGGFFVMCFVAGNRQFRRSTKV